MKDSPSSIPHPLIAVIPVAVLICLLISCIFMFGSDSLSGGSQVALLFSSAVCIAISILFYHTPWQAFESQLSKTFGDIAITLFILLAVGMVAGSGMVSGVVPTIIYYGVQIISP